MNDFEKETEDILKANRVSVNVDNIFKDDLCKLGQIWGINYMLQRINYILLTAEDMNEKTKNEFIVNNLKQLLKEIPYKQVYWEASKFDSYLTNLLFDMAGYPDETLSLVEWKG